MRLLNLRQFAKVGAVAAVGGAIFFGGNADVNAAPNDMESFREAYIGQYSTERMVDQDLTLVSPNFHIDVDSKAQVSADGIIRMSGELSWTYTNLKKNYSTNNNIPFFIEQKDNDLVLYVRRLGRWSKMTLPGLPVGIAAIWRANDTKTLNECLATVKAVEVLKDTSDMRIMNVTLDGNKFADILEEKSKSSLEKLTGDDLNRQKEILNRWINAVRANDVTFAWTVNKPNWETVTASFDLTNIMRAYARYVLDESAAGRVVLNDEERDLLDAMGYYAELKSYTTYISPKDNPKIDVPVNLANAPENDNALDDIFYEITTVVEK